MSLCHYCQSHEGAHAIQDPPGFCRAVCADCYTRIMGYAPSNPPSLAPANGYLTTAAGERLRPATPEEAEAVVVDGHVDVGGARCSVDRGVRRGDAYYSH